MNINFTLFSQAMAFAIFIWFTVKFVWPPLMRAIENRQKTIADGLAAGERGKQRTGAGKPSFRRCGKGSEAAGGRYHCPGGKTRRRDCRGSEVVGERRGRSYPRRRQGGGRAGSIPRQGKRCGSRWRIWLWPAPQKFYAAKWMPKRTRICLLPSKRSSKRWLKLARSPGPMPKPFSSWQRPRTSLPPGRKCCSSLLQSRRMSKFARSSVIPKVPPRRLGELLLGICGDRLNDEGRNFVLLLAENGRVEILPEVSEMFEQLKTQHEGVLDAKIISAFPMSDAQLRDLVARSRDQIQAQNRGQGKHRSGIDRRGKS